MLFMAKNSSVSKLGIGARLLQMEEHENEIVHAFVAITNRA
jgi:hypothetical protein